MPIVSHAAIFLEEVAETARRIAPASVEALCDELLDLRERQGRLFIVGVGGSAGNCSHAVNDFRKLCGIEAYAPTDNVSELTARTNDEGWSTVFSEWLKVSRAGPNDAILVFSVGGGNSEKNVSANLVCAIQEAKARGTRVLGIVGRDGGYTKKAGDAVVIIPTVEQSRVTPHAEAFQAVVWHCLVSHPKLQKNATKW
jgi:D-sedoheptulose 7-phosphate isomerase